MLNRELQRCFLERCSNEYPKPINGEEILSIFTQFYPLEGEEYNENARKQDVPKKLMANLIYLHEHELVFVEYVHVGQYIPNAKATAKGLDFLEDDGGLSAILNTVTVKFDVESTRELLTTGLISMGVPEEKKGILRTAIEGATTDTIKELMKSVLKNPMDAMGAARSLLDITF